MHVDRTTIRRTAAIAAAVMAAIYFLIGARVLHVVSTNEDPAFMLLFGGAAGGAFLLGALLLLRFDRRWLWMLGAALQVFVFIGYLAASSDRTPAFEPWGITLRVVQVPLLLALLYLAVRPSEPSEQRTAEIRR